MHPIKFHPLLMEKVWGGNQLFKLLKKGTPESLQIGESWELSDNSEYPSVLREGPYEGMRFSEFLSNHQKEIYGSQHAEFNSSFPLLFKYIDASDNLSIQVHPGAGSPTGTPKTETWYVVEAPAGAEIIVGISSGLPKAEVLELLKTENAEQVLNKVPVSKGDVLLIPAGTVHAITTGLLIYEVQQNSDTTFRLYDWGRLGTDGKPRELHHKESAEVIDYTVHDKHKISPIVISKPTHKEHWVVATRYFAIIKYSQCTEPFAIETRNKFQVFTCLEGKFLIQYLGGEMKMEKGETLLIPAVLEDMLIKDMNGNGEFLTCFIPDLKRDVVNVLIKYKFSLDVIHQLGGRHEITW